MASFDFVFSQVSADRGAEESAAAHVIDDLLQVDGEQAENIAILARTKHQVAKGKNAIKIFIVQNLLWAIHSGSPWKSLQVLMPQAAANALLFASMNVERRRL